MTPCVATEPPRAHATAGLQAMADLKRKHICSYDGCDFSTMHMSSFKRHKNVHDGVRPFACDHIGCEYTAGTSGDIKRHKQTHIRLCVCDRPGCDKAFTHPRSLEVLVRMHSAVATTGCDKRPIPGVPGCTASSHGQVFNAAGNIMTERIVAGYALVPIRVDGISRKYPSYISYCHLDVGLRRIRFIRCSSSRR